MDITISVKSLEQLNQFRRAYYNGTGTWLKDYNAIINVMFKMLDMYIVDGWLWQNLKKLKTMSL